MDDSTGGDKVTGDKIVGDKIAGDKVGGNKVEVGSIADSNNVIIAGGNVSSTYIDQSTKIDHVGDIHYESKKYFYIFNNVKQVFAFFGLMIFVVLVAGYGYWRTNQPDPMSGEFNIAVADFSEIPQTTQPVIAPIVSQMIFNFLDNEYQLKSLGAETQILHEKIGVISDATEAEKLAQRLNADVILYGDVVVFGDKATLLPKFFVSENFKSDVGEMIGQHQLALPIEFSTQEIIDFNSEIHTDLRQRAGIIVEFTRALSYLSSDELSKALTAIQASIDFGDSYGDFEGKEVLYLLASTITREAKDFELSESYAHKALTANSEYARAYIALANIYYDRDEFNEAIQYYQEALRIPNQPQGAHIVEKANLNLGHLYVYLYQTADSAKKSEYGSKALEHYKTVIDIYEDKHDLRTKDIAAWAYYGTGIVLEGEGNTKDAEDVYKQVLNLTDDPDLESRIKTRLQNLDK